MGTNFYRIPEEWELEEKRHKLCANVLDMDISPNSVIENFRVPIEGSWENQNIWEKFTDGVCIHLGKRSGGWQFLWNFHKMKYYNNRETLFSFIRSGRVVDEYGVVHDADEFIEMALNWCTDGEFVGPEYYKKNPKLYRLTSNYDSLIDGLRVSAHTEFS